MPHIEGFAFETPTDFRVEEVTMGLSGGMPDGGTSPSLIVQSKLARPGATAEIVAAEVLGELLQTMPGMKNGTKAELTFDDGVTGVVLAYAVTSSKGELRQYFAFRVDNGRVCTATLTAPTATMSPASATTLMKCLTSIRPA